MLAILTGGNKTDKNVKDALPYTFIVYTIETSTLFSKQVAFEQFYLNM